MATPYIPHVKTVSVRIEVTGHQMDSVCESLSLDDKNSTGTVRGELADAVLSVLRLAAEARLATAK